MVNLNDKATRHAFCLEIPQCIGVLHQEKLKQERRVYDAPVLVFLDEDKIINFIYFVWFDVESVQ
ncbi:hypothetical protein AGMMS49592_3980 [Endomicrobiia bacterium]|nr:hypothetical protein AGMMS49592_3980 [Endomicrobiia bacterium]